jgi:hydrogenase expression/formation protein HypC
MCLGIPMRVVASEGLRVIAEGRGERQSLDCSLLGPQPVGTWLLAFIGSAREVLDAERAAAIDAALDAVFALQTGAEFDLDACFPDLAGRTPQLPPHLQKESA